jgi:hypothetical protein
MTDESFDQNFTWHEWTFVTPDDSAEDRTDETTYSTRWEIEGADARFQSELASFFDVR